MQHMRSPPDGKLFPRSEQARNGFFQLGFIAISELKPQKIVNAAHYRYRRFNIGQ